MLIMALLAFLSCALYHPYGFDELHLEDVPDGKPLSFSSKYWLGTDQFGRDYLTRCIYGGRIPLSVGLVSVGISLAIVFWAAFPATTAWPWIW